ncbi:MAG: FeoB-associated Cys-rich membrane protein [Oscillospiraceae bacterium]
MAGIIIIGIIAAYCIFVISKKIRDIKKGKYCSCGCQNCHSNCKKY